MPRLHWPNSDESERTHFTTWWHCNWSNLSKSPFFGYTSNILFNFWFQFLCPPFPAQQNFIRKSQQGPFTHQTWPLHGSYLVFGCFSCEARSKSLLPHLPSMRSNRFMWDLQKITRSRIIILSINRPEDDWRLHDPLKSQCFTMSNL